MIVVNNLVKKFDNRGIAGIHDLSFEVKSGEIMSIMGPNGSGKSTLLNILRGTLKQDSGSFLIDGAPAFFPENDELSSGNVLKFLIKSVTIDVDEEKKIQLARDLADTFEFTFQLRQNLSDLSSGQRQKVLLSKELINRPALLLMDEPFAHLDPFTRKDILKGLFQYIKDQQITVVWVTHDLEEAFRFSDKIALMNFGKFEQHATPFEMVTSPRNLFVSKFMGYRNFYPMSFWNSATNDTILVIPDHAWEETPEGIEYTIKSCHPGIQKIEYTMEQGERTLHLARGPKSPVLELGARIKLLPLWKECFQIPL